MALSGAVNLRLLLAHVPAAPAPRATLVYFSGTDGTGQVPTLAFFHPALRTICAMRFSRFGFPLRLCDGTEKSAQLWHLQSTVRRHGAISDCSNSCSGGTTVQERGRDA